MRVNRGGGGWNLHVGATSPLRPAPPGLLPVLRPYSPAHRCSIRGTRGSPRLRATAFGARRQPLVSDVGHRPVQRSVLLLGTRSRRRTARWVPVYGTGGRRVACLVRGARTPARLSSKRAGGNGPCGYAACLDSKALFPWEVSSPHFGIPSSPPPQYPHPPCPAGAGRPPPLLGRGNQSRRERDKPPLRIDTWRRTLVERALRVDAETYRAVWPELPCASYCKGGGCRWTIASLPCRAVQERVARTDRDTEE